MTSFVTDDGVVVSVETPTYTWRFDRRTGDAAIVDADGRQVAVGPLQPSVVVARDGTRRCSAGTLARVTIVGDSLEVLWEGVNEAARLTTTVRFARDAIWFETTQYETARPEDIVSLYLFGRARDDEARPGLRHTFVIQPGISETAGISPILPTEVGLDLVSWLGRGSMGGDSQIYQQWGLPSHYVCGASRVGGHNQRDTLTDALSDAFCWGLAHLPAADAKFHLADEATSPVFEYRGDLWGHLRGPGTFDLGALSVLTLGRTYRDAARAYLRVLVNREIVTPKDSRPQRARVATASQFNTWGAQCAMGKEAGRFDQETLEMIYDGLRSSALEPELFVVDAKWEGAYGRLEHDADRFPSFEEFIERVRADGYKLGLWAAFLRTDAPSTVGLETRHLLHDATGRPIEKNNEFERKPYYLFDVTQPEVVDVLRERIRAFVRRYDPDLVKFDFGYELPSLAVALPAQPQWAGERLLARAADVLLGALREAKPDIAIMYYSLSPLLTAHVDQHSHDDLYLCVHDYAEEGNRRLFFSSLLGELGIPTYGSGGYAWRSMPDVWLDSAIAGPLGLLTPFEPDEHGDRVSVEAVALYEGLRGIARRTVRFRVDPVSPVTLGSVSGARSSSWLRYEGEALTMACVRACDAADPKVTAHGLRSDVGYAIAALGDDATLATADRVGIVALGTGELRLTRVGRRACARRRTLDGTWFAVDLSTEGCEVVVPLVKEEAGLPVTWTEIRFQ